MVRFVVIATLVASLVPAVAATPAVGADVVLPPILLTGADAEDSAGSRTSTWSYQIRNPNPFPLTASIEVNTTAFNREEVGPLGGNWALTQVVDVAVAANSETSIIKRAAIPPALGNPSPGVYYAMRAFWVDYPTALSMNSGLRWPQALRVPASAGATFTDPGLPFVGRGGSIEGLWDNRGPDYVAALSCDFDAAGNPSGDFTFHWWVQNTAFTGNPEILSVGLNRPNESKVPGVTGLPRQTVPWTHVREGSDSVSASALTLDSWQRSRGWFRPEISNPNPGGTAADNTYPWDGSDPPGSVWETGGSVFDKHVNAILQAENCATKYANLPTYDPNGAPSVTLTTPVDGATVSDTVGMRVAVTDDDPVGSLAVEVSVNGGGAWSPAPWNAGQGRYIYSWDTTQQPDGAATLLARATDSDGNTSTDGPITVTVSNNPTGSLLIVAGDVASCALTTDDAVGDLITDILATESAMIALPGDAAYPNGTAADFDCFDDAWGQHKALIRPAPGNHDYDTPGASGYFGYFGSAAGDPNLGYYSWDIDPNWHAVALNSNCGEIAGGCAAGGAQEQWLRADLAANSDKHVIAYWHHPRWTNNAYGDDEAVAPLWQALHDYGAEIVLSGHEHHYERYQPLDATGNPDPTHGIREFIVGTGGTTLRTALQPASPLSEERRFGDHGVLKLYLTASGYSWEFESLGAYRDSGTGSVHGPPPGSGGYAATVRDDGANIYWRLGDSAGIVAADELGLNDATYVGGPGLGSAGLVAGGDTAVTFDGVDDTIHLDNAPQLNQGGPYSTKSVEMWFRADTVAGRQTLYEQGSISRGLNLYIDGGRLYGGIYNTSDNGGDTPWGPVFISTPITAGATHHAVLVFDRPDDELRLYVDGALAATGSGVGQLYNHGLSAIGAQRDWARYHNGAQSGTRNHFAGVIDEVAHYPGALTTTQVASHYAAGTSGGPIAPSASITSPTEGQLVTGSVTIRVNATDDDPLGSLSVDVSVNNGANWESTAWNSASGRYEYTWDSTQVADGARTFRARATDSDGLTTNATPIGVTVANGGGAAYADVVSSDAPSIYWRLGESAGTALVDETGSQTNSYLGSPQLGASGLVTDPDTAVDFDGTDDTVHLDNSLELNRSDPFLTKTVELWFEADSVSGRQVILEQGSVSRGLNIYLLGGTLYAGVYNTSDSGGDTPWGPVWLSTAVSANTTYHVVLVFDQPSDTVTLYVDGSVADTASGIGGLYAHGRSAIASQWDWARFHDGARFGNTNFFNGTLDEIAIYPTALNASRIAAHFSAGS